MISVESLQDQRVSIFSHLKNRNLLGDKLFIADSPRVITQLLKDGVDFIKLFGEESEIAKYQDYHISENYIASKRLMQKIVGYKLHHGLIGLAAIPKNKKELIECRRLLALNGLSSPENVGSIVRSAAALGFDGILIDKYTYHPYNRRSVRVSMGYIAKLNIFQVDNLYNQLIWLQEKNFEVLCLDNSEKAQLLSARSTPLVCVIGKEVGGINQEILKKFPNVKIPINSSVDSINVGHAAAIAMSVLGSY